MHSFHILPPALLAGLLLAPQSPTRARAQEAAKPIDYMIVVTGGELLTGAYPDAHTHFLTRTLHPMGFHCIGSMTADDRKPDIESALRYASERAPLVIVTGGLGPTDNDITRETLAAFTGIPLREHPDVLSAMEIRFNTSRDQMRANLRRQAQVPARGAYLKSPNGTAAGLVFESENKVIVALPGPPKELEPMVREELVPYLNRRFGAHVPGCSLTVRFVGIGQSAIDEALERHTTMPPNIILGSQFDGMRVDFTFALPHDAPADRERLEALKRQIEGCLREYIYAFGTRSLEDVVLAQLDRRGATLAVAEVGSGGALAAGLSGEASATNLLSGAFVAAAADRMRQLVRVADAAWQDCKSSEDRVRVLAKAAALETGSPYAIAVGELENDAAGNRSVAVAFRLPNGTLETRRCGMRGAGASARSGLATQVLDQFLRLLR